MNPTLNALLDALISTSTDDYGNPLDSSFSPSNVCPVDADRLYREFQSFMSAVEPLINTAVGDKWECLDDFYDVHQPAQFQTEHDYILTRNHHGAGFWDGDWNEKVSDILTKAAQSQREVVATVGDDGRIYIL